MKLKIQLYQFTCANCSHKFQAPVYPFFDMSYGEFILRTTESNRLIYLNANHDEAFLEASRILDEINQVKKLFDHQKFDPFQEIVHVAYDPDKWGHYYKIGIDPHCPNCGANESKCFQATNPPEYKVMDIPVASSVLWKTLSSEEKKERIELELDKFFKNDVTKK